MRGRKIQRLPVAAGDKTKAQWLKLVGNWQQNEASGDKSVYTPMNTFHKYVASVQSEILHEAYPNFLNKRGLYGLINNCFVKSQP